MLNRPACLHIPTLYEGEPAIISWGSVDGAISYQLEVVFDMTFEQASTGRSWTALEAARKTWAQFEAENLSWEELEALSARGVTWQNIEFEDLTWEQIEAKNLTWSDIETFAVRFIIFDGLGEPVRGPDQGLTWAFIDSQGKTWAQIDADGLTWQEFELLSDPSARGISWAGLEGRFLSWDDIEAKGLTWDEFENLTPDNRTHMTFTTIIPLYKRTASFRVRAFNGTTYSPYLTSPLIPIIPVFHRDDVLNLEVRRGSHYPVQLHARGIGDFREIIMRLRYASAALQLERLALERPGAKDDMFGKTYAPNHREAFRTSGRLDFQGIKQMRPGNDWNGMVVSILFKALRTGSTDITLS